MAKKSRASIKAQLQQAAPVEEEAAPIMSSSSDDFSDDELAIEVPEPQEKKSSHTINITTEKAPEQAAEARNGVTTIFVGNLPKHFHEPELKKYFSQFGEVHRTRVSRNKQSGAPRGYGFVGFKDAEVAKIAAETMNNYLIMGKLLKVEVVADQSINYFPSKLKSSFREFDWGSKAFAEHNAPKPRATWVQLESEFENRKAETFAKLKEQGFDYVLEA